MRVAVPLEQCWHEVPGGTTRAALDLVAALDERDDVEVVGVAAKHDGPPPEIWRPAVPVHQLGLPRPLLYEAWHGVGKPLVEQATGPVDVLHTMGGAVAPSRAPYVATVHDLAFLHHPGMFTRHGLRFFRRGLALIKRRADIVLCSSRATLTDCLEAGIGPDRLREVPLAVTVTEPTADEVRETLARFGLEKPYVVFVGTLEPRKNLRGLFDAWRLLARDDVELVVVGQQGWGEALGDGPPPDGVRFTGFVPDATRDAFYVGAVASCYPSVFEGFGMPVLESMSLGCPVVTSSGVCTEELVVGGAGLAVDPRDPSAIAEALGSLLDDDGRRDALAAAGRIRAQQYSWERTAGLVVDAYRAVA